MNDLHTPIISFSDHRRLFQATILLACLACLIMLSGQRSAQTEPRPAMQPASTSSALQMLNATTQFRSADTDQTTQSKITNEPTLLDQAAAFIEPFEGRRHRAYRDSRGNMTIGIGFNLDRAGAADDLEELLPGINYYALRRGSITLTDEQIDILLHHDTQRAIDTARRQFKNFDQLPTQAQLILIDMTFNTGSLQKWRNLRSAMAREDYSAAADAMYRSQWRKQTGQRARHLIQLMRELATS